MEYIIRETDEFYPLSVLFQENGMGVPISERAPDQIIKMWRMDDSETGELMAAVTLEIRDNVYTLGDIAVRADLQRKGYGRIMQDVVFVQAKKLKVSEVWACAKEPEFYKKLGWKVIDWEDAPDIAIHCAECGKRGFTCFPQIMKYEF